MLGLLAYGGGCGERMLCEKSRGPDVRRAWLSRSTVMQW